MISYRYITSACTHSHTHTLIHTLSLSLTHTHTHTHTRSQVQYYGLIKQATGEDWENANISLSTAQPSIGGSAPSLPARLIRFKRPPPREYRYIEQSVARGERSLQMAGLLGARLDYYDPTIEDSYGGEDTEEFSAFADEDYDRLRPPGKPSGKKGKLKMLEAQPQSLAVEVAKVITKKRLAVKFIQIYNALLGHSNIKLLTTKLNPGKLPKNIFFRLVPAPFFHPPQVSSGLFNTTYAIPRTTSIPADNTEHKVSPFRGEGRGGKGADGIVKRSVEVIYELTT